MCYHRGRLFVTRIGIEGQSYRPQMVKQHLLTSSRPLSGAHASSSGLQRETVDSECVRSTERNSL